MEKLVIVGGGVAGLSCLNALLDRDISPLLLEASMIGSPKMCGEFLAPPALPVLEQWGLGPLPKISQVRFFGGEKVVDLAFMRPAAAYERHQAEVALAAFAKKRGGRIREHAPIKIITPATSRTPYVLHLASGEIMQAEDVIFATGKFSQSTLRPAAHAYVGFKTHISHVVELDTLLMYSLVDGYLGIVPLAPNKSNLTCLIKKDVVDRAGGRAAFLEGLFDQEGPLKQAMKQVDLSCCDWLEGEAPGFGLKNLPPWPRAYWIGDAFASIHPAIGHGFAHSITSALLAADCYVQQNSDRYYRMMKQNMRSRLMISQSMHYLLQKPRLSRVISSSLEDNHRMRSLLLKKLFNMLLKKLDY